MTQAHFSVPLITFKWATNSNQDVAFGVCGGAEFSATFSTMFYYILLVLLSILKEVMRKIMSSKIELEN